MVCSRAVLQTPSWFIRSLTQWSFVKISLASLHSQTLRARELKLWEKVHLPTCHMSGNSYNVSHVTFQISHVPGHESFFFGKVVKPVSRGSGINGPTPSSQLTDSAFSSKPSKHHYIRTVRARGLTFWENVHPHIYIYALFVCNFYYLWTKRWR